MILTAPPRLYIGAPRKSSGKTLLTVGLGAAFAHRGLWVQAFKKGLDYIDPLWHSAATGRSCRNLDPFSMGREGVTRNFLRHGAGAELALVEGNMGLFDGQDLDGSDCGAAVAGWLETPILLVVDCAGLSRGVAPLVLGHVGFPGGERIAGVILNNVASTRQEGRLKAALVHYGSPPVLGVIPRSETVAIDERHLGLAPVNEREDLAQRLTVIRDHVAAHVDLEGLLALARRAPAWTATAAAPDPSPPRLSPLPRVRVGYAKDRAFHFYYPENLEALERAGAELVPFDLLEDPVLPEVDGLFIGGGFPEMFMESLAANRPLLEGIRRSAEAGMPIYAECGGLMLLSRFIRWGERVAPMAGVLPVDVAMHRRPQGFGYVTLEGTGALPWPPPGQVVRGHEFHHSQVERMESDIKFAYRLGRGVGLGERRDGLIYRNVLASYAHLHADGAPGWAEFLVDFWRRGA
ncbi:MAG: cobyrinate a,c-diamide synthase [Magnetococcales bacterium]|nr:cobyrinate a,c-diamide synthase [Magnetococcales bacterium]